MNKSLLKYCVCPSCRGPLRHSADQELTCAQCGERYQVDEGIPVLLPKYEEPVQMRYLANYDRIARDDLNNPIVANRHSLLHESLIRFIGNVRTKKVLDIGSADAGYLKVLNARVKVAVDIAMPYLRTIPESSGILRVCGDAERLPVHPGHFDVVVISDVLEHLLTPERLVNLLAQWCHAKSRVIIHIPWEESLEPYKDLGYEFVHLRSFNHYNFRQLFRDFYVKKTRKELPRLSDPIVFQCERWLPRPLFSALLHAYFHSDLKHVEYAYRKRWIDELPRRRWLLWFYPPQCRMFELRKYVKPGVYWWNYIQAKMTRWRRRLDQAQQMDQPKAAASRERECVSHGSTQDL